MLATPISFGKKKIRKGVKNMPASRVVELVSSITSLIVSIVVYLYVTVSDLKTIERTGGPSPSLEVFFLLTALVILPSGVAAVGSYVHAIRRNLWGLGFVGVAVLMQIIIIIAFLLPLAWGYGGRGLLVCLLELLLLSVAFISGCFDALLRKGV
jgi:hypothetical protein